MQKDYQIREHAELYMAARFFITLNYSTLESASYKSWPIFSSSPFVFSLDIQSLQPFFSLINYFSVLFLYPVLKILLFREVLIVSFSLIISLFCFCFLSLNNNFYFEVAFKNDSLSSLFTKNSMTRLHFQRGFSF